MALSVAQLREIDRRCVEEFGIPTLLLMENAGLRAAEVALNMIPRDAHTVCVCGAGNNGGDGFVIARHLSNRRVPVRIVVVGRTAAIQPTSAPGMNLQIIRRMGIPSLHILRPEEIERVEKEIAGAGLIVDALCGIGLKGKLRPLQRACVEAMNGSGRKVLAVDVPSGLDADTGRPLPVAVHAAKTVTFVAMKRGFLNPEAKDHIGKVEVVDIGVPLKLVREFGEG